MRVSDVDLTIAPEQISATQIVDAVERTADSVVDLLAALRLKPTATPLPEPADRPSRPPRPAAYGEAHLRKLALPDGELYYHDQDQLLRDLVYEADGAHEGEALELLARLRARVDVIKSVADRIDEVTRQRERTRATAERARERDGATLGPGQPDGSSPNEPSQRTRKKPAAPAKRDRRAELLAGQAELTILATGPDPTAVEAMLTAFGISKPAASAAVQKTPAQLILTVRRPDELVGLLRQKGATVQVVTSSRKV